MRHRILGVMCVLMFSGVIGSGQAALRIVVISGEDNPEISAELAESAFDAAPLAVGDRVLATWAPDRAHPLHSSSSAAVAAVNAA